MIASDTVVDYLVESRSAPDALQLEMEEHGHRDHIPIVPAETAALLEVLTAATGARQVVEVGTAIGYSTRQFARALPAGGVVVSFEIDRERHEAARAYLERAGVLDRTDLRLQDATAGLSELELGAYDIAFIDGVKGDYAAHLELVLPLVRPGGLVIVDNALMDGTVAAGQAEGHWTQEQVDGMRAFNARVLGDPGLTASLLPVGDGVLLAVKRA
jgi:predicted O-methyltransferase YrrM